MNLAGRPLPAAAAARRRVLMVEGFLRIIDHRLIETRFPAARTTSSVRRMNIGGKIKKRLDVFQFAFTAFGHCYQAWRAVASVQQRALKQYPDRSGRASYPLKVQLIPRDRRNLADKAGGGMTSPVSQHIALNNRSSAARRVTHATVPTLKRFVTTVAIAFSPPARLIPWLLAHLAAASPAEYPAAQPGQLVVVGRIGANGIQHPPAAVGRPPM